MCENNRPTLPWAYGIVRNGEQVGSERSLAVARHWLEAEIVPLYPIPDFREMREMLRAMQAGELTVSRGIEILDMWHAGNWNNDMLPPVRQDLIEEDSMPVEIIDRLKKRRDELLAVLEEIEAIVPAQDGTGGFIVEYHGENGEYLVSHNVDPMWVVQEMATVAHNAISRAKGSAS